ncbi:MAG TPA: P22 coat - protein 5 family protein [Desulfobacteraceae bacterium]|nr:P22 coat - protein 5 family protein [Desulfobacteraceae bacterium]|tara:strand:- start:328 stop:1479 length:1152 start_codon:yes stop_codon:yes gene_type:complete
MANTLTNLIPVIYEGLDVVSREQAGAIRAVSMDSKAETAAKGQIVRSHITPEATTEDVTPGNNPADSGDQAPGYVDVSITKSKVSPIRWSGEEQLSVGGQYNPILIDQFAQSIRALVNLVEADITALSVYASRAYGTAGTAPFGTSGDLSDFAQTLKILTDNGAPGTDRHLVLDSSAIANIRGKQSGLFEVNRAGNDDLLRRGTIGMVQGLDVHESAAAASHTKGTGASYAVDGAHSAGDTTITLKTGTGTVLAGDFVTFAGDTNKYMVTTGTAAAGDIVLAAPGLLADVADGTAVTVGGTHTANMAFARSAVVLAARHPEMPKDQNGKPIDSAIDVMEVVDPLSGLSFQVAMYAQYRRVKYEVGLAWGAKMIKPEHACILLG